MKTAMQDFIEQLENNKHLESVWEDFKIKLLEKEKEQIANAFRNGSTSSMLGGGHWTQYYNQTYNQNK